MNRTIYIGLFIFVPMLLGAQSVNVPLDHWAYGFLDRLETKNLFYSNELLTRPISRSALAQILVEIAENIKKNPARLSKTEWRLFDQLKGDFVDELQNLGVDMSGCAIERHTLNWTDPPSLLYLDLYGQESVISNRGAQYLSDNLLSETRMGGVLRGHVGGTIGYYMDARNSITRGSDIKNENFDVSQGSPVVISGSNVYQDRALAYFIYEKPWLRIELGQDEMEWGPGFHGGLSLTRNAPPAGLFRLKTRFHRLTFNSVHSFLNSSLDSKYLAGHRLDLRLVPGLNIGATETVIYGKRDIEFAYLNPLMPYHIAEHHLGDKDNNSMSFDVTLTWIPSVKIYAEYFIDDMTSSESLLKYYGNKFAFLGGVYWVNPLQVSNIDFRLEYARIEPFVYAHYDSINIYSHYDKTMGHWLGPNSDDLFALLGYQPGRDLRAEFTFERIRKGKGDIDTHSEPESGTTKKFLDGIVACQYLTSLKIIDQIFRDFYVSVSYSYSDTRNVNRIQGKNSFDHLTRFEFSFNY